MIYHTHETLRAKRHRTSWDDEGYHLDDLGQTVDEAVADLEDRSARFDAIVVTGMSGVVVGAPVALALKKPLVILRKHRDDSHAGSIHPWVGADRIGQTALFLDDFVSAGDTLQRVREHVMQLGAQVRYQYTYKYRKFERVEEFVLEPELGGAWLSVPLAVDPDAVPF